MSIIMSNKKNMSSNTPSYELFGVEPNTPEFAFPGPEACSDLIVRAAKNFEKDKSGKASPYVIISEVDEKCLNEHFGESGFDANRLAGKEYPFKEKLLLVPID